MKRAIVVALGALIVVVAIIAVIWMTGGPEPGERRPVPQEKRDAPGTIEGSGMQEKPD